MPAGYNTESLRPNANASILCDRAFEAYRSGRVVDQLAVLTIFIAQAVLIGTTGGLLSTLAVSLKVRELGTVGIEIPLSTFISPPAA